MDLLVENKMGREFRNIFRNFWNDFFCEHVNRTAQKKILRSNELWHKGGFINKVRSILLHNRNVKRYNCEIYPQALIGKGLYIPHCVGIVVGNTAEIGDNCVIFPNVVIGAKYSPNSKNPKGRRHAKIGNNCVLGANSSIIGAITIGDNVTIGTGSIVTVDISDNVTVVGVNKIIS